MLNVRAQISLFIGLSVLVTACGNGAAGKKVKINKGNRSKDVSTWVKDVVYTENVTTPVTTVPATPGRPSTTTPATIVNLSCLSVPKLVNAMAAKNTAADAADQRELIAVSVFDLDFVTPSEETRANKTLVKFTSTGDTEPIQRQKANYFFQFRKPEFMSDMVAAKDLPASNFGLKLLNVAAQEKCSSVTFNEIVRVAGQDVPRVIGFRIASSNPRRLILQKIVTPSEPQEYRIYQLDGRAQVRVSVIKQVTDVPVCGVANGRTQFASEDYIFSRSRDLDRIQISRNLANLFYNFGFKSPEIEEQITAGPGAGVKPADARRKVAKRERVMLSGSTFSYLLELVRQGVAGKDLACSPARP